MQLIDQPISIRTLTDITVRSGWDMVKAVVDVKKGILMLDAELHADEEQELIHLGSRQSDLWGINLYPELFGEDDFIEFDSMINVRPSQGNMSRNVESEDIRQAIRDVVAAMISSSEGFLPEQE